MKDLLPPHHHLSLVFAVIFAICRGEHGECWLCITSGLPEEGWRACAPPGTGSSGVIGSFLRRCYCIFLCLRLCWVAEQYIFKMGDDFINLEEYMFVSPSKARHGAIYCASLVEKYVTGSQGLMKTVWRQMQPHGFQKLVYLRCMLHPRISP